MMILRKKELRDNVRVVQYYNKYSRKIRGKSYMMILRKKELRDNVRVEQYYNKYSRKIQGKSSKT